MVVFFEINAPTIRKRYNRIEADFQAAQNIFLQGIYFRIRSSLIKSQLDVVVRSLLFLNILVAK